MAAYGFHKDIASRVQNGRGRIRMIRTLGLLLCVAVIACTENPDSYVLAQVSTEVEQSKGVYDNDDIYPPPSDLFSGCDCQRGHLGMELIATVCHSENVNGPWTRGCLYQRGKPIYWSNEQRGDYPL